MFRILHCRSALAVSTHGSLTLLFREGAPKDNGMTPEYLDNVLQGVHGLVHSDQVVNLGHVVYYVLYHSVDEQVKEPPGAGDTQDTE